MALSPDVAEFVEENGSAAMITVGDDGMAKAVRVGVALVDGKMWSSGHRRRVRTARLRRDPRCTLFLFDARYAYVTLETRVSILDGPDAPALNLRLFRTMQKRPSGPLMWYGEELDEDAFLQRMVDEGRLIYEFDVLRSYALGLGASS
jgi:uncharacterized pyridoxamine 5'-phosphate oxidase family protein